jgi:CHAT domain-containing protein
VLLKQQLIGSDATRNAYRSLLETVTRLVSSHHAQSRFDNAAESGLKLSDGMINVLQLLSPGWRFPQLDELYLSCCETGLFLPNRPLDEPVALSTGFLCAGARGVIASQWSVYDLSAALLSVLYHEQRRQGKNRSLALQAAQKTMREMTGKAFQANYRQSLLRQIEGEQQRLKNNPEQLMRLSDCQRLIKNFAKQERPFEHPVHWAGLGCYGLR